MLRAALFQEAEHIEGIHLRLCLLNHIPVAGEKLLLPEPLFRFRAQPHRTGGPHEAHHRVRRYPAQEQTGRKPVDHCNGSLVELRNANPARIGRKLRVKHARCRDLVKVGIAHVLRRQPRPLVKHYKYRTRESAGRHDNFVFASVTTNQGEQQQKEVRESRIHRARRCGFQRKHGG